MAEAPNARTVAIRGTRFYGRDLSGLRRDTVQLTPPFFLDGVSARVFPLRASVSALQGVCDAQLNCILPGEVGRFRAAGPYVYLMMLDYGRLSEVQNVGWFAQKEILFCFPVHWYKVVGKRWRFHDWAVLTPFIYVDDDLSVPLGRQVYGWGKTGARLTPTLGRWMVDPRATVQKARVSTLVYPEIYEGRALRSEVFLEVEREPPVSLVEYPPNPRMPLAPWNVWWHLARGSMGMVRDLEGWMAGSGIFPVHSGVAPRNLGRQAARFGQFFRPGGRGAVWNTLNVKQFRKVDEPDEACYQALTNGPMRLRSLHAAGPLGGDLVLAGDASGGYGIKLHEWPSIPIVQSLGLEVHRRWQGQGPTVALLKPVLPFWYRCDMEYLRGQTVAWRADEPLWAASDGLRYQAPAGANHEIRYNTAVTSSPDPIVGPFEFRETTIRILPLLARRASVERFLERYAGGLTDQQGPQTRLVLWGPQRGPSSESATEPGEPEGDDGDLVYVYLTASSFGDVDSATNNIGDWARYEVSFLIPVKRQTRPDAEAEWVSRSVGLVPAYTFVDTTAAEIARGEVLGVTAMQASFVKPESAWMSEHVPFVDGQQVLLRLEAEVLPALGEGRGTERFSILEIAEQVGDRQGRDTRTRVDVDRWAGYLKSELRRKKTTRKNEEVHYEVARAAAVERLGKQKAFPFYAVKEFQDVEDPKTACYTALIRFRRTIDQVIDIREIEKLVTLQIHDFPSLNIVDDLGLVGSRVSGNAAGISYQLQPIRPFFVSVTMQESLGERLVWRAGEGRWRSAETWVDPPSGNARQWQAEVGQPTHEGGLHRLIEKGDPRDLEKLINQFDLGDFTHERAMDAIEVIDPQIMIEAVLSREWGNQDHDARWLTGWRRLCKQYEDAVSGIRDDSLADVENDFFCGVLRGMGQRPGRVSGGIAGEILPDLRQFTQWRLSLDTLWADFAEYLIRREYDRGAAGRRLRLKKEKKPKRLHQLLSLIATRQVTGWPFAPDHWTQYVGTEATELQRRLKALLDGKLTTIMNEGSVRDPIWHARVELREAISLARAICDLQREAVLIKVSKLDQKPDFCVLRSSVGAARDKLLPRTWSWDGEWYYGPPLDGDTPRSPSAGCPEDNPEPMARERAERHRRAGEERAKERRAEKERAHEKRAEKKRPVKKRAKKRSSGKKRAKTKRAVKRGSAAPKAATEKP